MKIAPAGSLSGAVAVPGDKSVSHRAVMLGAIGEGDTVVENFGRSADTEATVGAMRALGAPIGEGADRLVVSGGGLRGLREPDGPIDCTCLSAGTRCCSICCRGAPRGSRIGSTHTRTHPETLSPDQAKAVAASAPAPSRFTSRT